MKNKIIIGGLTVLLISSAAAGLVVHQRDGERIRELERMVSQLQESERQLALDRRISKQMENIANGQQILSEERSREAIRQSDIAQAATLRSEAERQNALRAQAAAEQSAQEALNSYQVAEQRRQEASEQQLRAERAKRTADTLNYISLGRTLGSQSYSIYRTGDTEIGNMLAYASYRFTNDYGGDLYAPAVYQALTQSAGGRQSWSIHNGSISDMDVFPNSNRLLTVSNCGEMLQHERKDGKLTTRQLFSNKNYCFRDVIASREGTSYALSQTGHLVVVSPEKTEIVTLEGLAKPFRLERMSDGRQLLIIGERSLALFDMAARKVVAARQLDFSIVCASRRDNVPILFDDKGRMHLVRSLDNMTSEKVPVRGTVSAYTSNREEGLAAYGMMDGTIYLVGRDGQSRRLVGHLSQVTKMSFFGRILYSSSYDGKLLFWMTGESQIRPVTLLQAGSWIVGFAVDASRDYIWIGDSDGAITQYLVSLPLIGQRLRRNVKRDFTRDEWNYYVGKGIPYRRLTAEEW